MSYISHLFDLNRQQFRKNQFETNKLRASSAFETHDLLHMHILGHFATSENKRTQTLVGSELKQYNITRYLHNANAMQLVNILSPANQWLEHDETQHHGALSDNILLRLIIEWIRNNIYVFSYPLFGSMELLLTQLDADESTLHRNRNMWMEANGLCIRLCLETVSISRRDETK